MSVEADLERGELESGLQRLRQEATSDPGRLLMAYQLEIRTHRFDDAARTLARIVQLDPGFAPAAKELELSANAERLRVARATDATVAGKRSALAPPPPFALELVRAAVSHARGDAAGTKDALASAEAHRPKTPGTLTWTDGRTKTFTDLVDTDDLTGATLPCFEAGQILDVPFVEIRSIVFSQPRTSFDSLWAPAEVVTRSGERLHVRIPALYVGAGVHAEPSVRIGTMTTWDHDRGYAIASGQRDFKLTTSDGGMSMVGLRQIARIDFEGPAMTAGLGGAPSGAGAFGNAPASGGSLFGSAPASGTAPAGGLFSDAARGLAPAPAGNPFAQASAGAPPSGNPFAQAGAPASGNPFAQASKGMAPLGPAPRFPVWRTLIGGAGVALGLWIAFHAGSDGRFVEEDVFLGGLVALVAACILAWGFFSRMKAAALGLPVLVGLLAFVCYNRVQANRDAWFAETAALEVAQPVCTGATLPDAPELGAGPRTLLAYEGFGSGSWYAMRSLPRSWRPAANAPPTLVACLMRSSGYGASPTITIHVARTGEVLAALPVDVYGDSDAALTAAVQPFVSGAR
jgi:protein involved in temperature-dependent protein secretion